ncbi:hypothetical protein PLCT2_02739 [Planctomycetaceae bacterium]|nr:hypothetical protein PLCT2_02739 [Planctomycetaceae bacterium]
MHAVATTATRHKGKPVAASKLSDGFVLEKFKHLYEQYFDGARIEIRTDGESERFIYAEYTHPRFKMSWLPGNFCGLRVQCEPAAAFAKAYERNAK